MTTVRHAITAFVLLVAALAGIEFWMRSQASPAIHIVTSQTTAADQTLLVPSAVYHHELRRLSKATFRATDHSAEHVIRVNSFGCRGDEPTASPKEGVYRILLLGDDTICGTSVDEDETVSARLKQVLLTNTGSEFEVINGGLPGYCPLLSWLKFENDLAKLKPQLVILHVDMTDVADDATYRSLLQVEDQNTICSHPSLRLQPKPDSSVMQFLKQSATASWLFAKTRQHGPELLSSSTSATTSDVGLHWIADNAPDLRLHVRHALEPIKDLQDAISRSGSRLLVTTSPVLWQVTSADNAPELSRRCGITGVTPFESEFPFEVLRRFCEQSMIHFCDTSKAFRVDNAEKLFSKDAPVLSRLGMALYAREIGRCLIDDPPSQWTN